MQKKDASISRLKIKRDASTSRIKKNKDAITSRSGLLLVFQLVLLTLFGMSSGPPFLILKSDNFKFEFNLIVSFCVANYRNV